MKKKKKNWIGEPSDRPELEVVLGQPQCGTPSVRLSVRLADRQLIHRVTRTCRAGSSPSAAASAAGADAVEQVGVGVVVEAGGRGVTG